MMHTSTLAVEQTEQSQGILHSAVAYDKVIHRGKHSVTLLSNFLNSRVQLRQFVCFPTVAHHRWNGIAALLGHEKRRVIPTNSTRGSAVGRSDKP